MIKKRLLLSFVVFICSGLPIRMHGQETFAEVFVSFAEALRIQEYSCEFSVRQVEIGGMEQVFNGWIVNAENYNSSNYSGILSLHQDSLLLIVNQGVGIMSLSYAKSVEIDHSAMGLEMDKTAVLDGSLTLVDRGYQLRWIPPNSPAYESIEVTLDKRTKLPITIVYHMSSDSGYDIITITYRYNSISEQTFPKIETFIRIGDPCKVQSGYEQFRLIDKRSTKLENS